MDDTGKNVEDENAPIYVLLPFCTELETDVFLGIFKSIVNRSRLGEDYLESAFIAGMDAETIFIKTGDVSSNLKDPTTKSQQILVSKFLGFWSVKNFPSMGKKVFGQRWQPLEGRTVNIGNNQMIDETEMDATISARLNLRVIELTVKNSTLEKLKRFVSVPATVCGNNPIRISRKMVMFDIQDAYMEHCWHALKFGGFTQQIEIDRREFQRNRTESSLKMKSNTAPQLISTSEHSIMDAETPTGSNSDAVSRLAASGKRPHAMILDDDESGSDPASGDLAKFMQNMTNEISKLTKWFDPEDELDASKQTIAELKRKLAESNQMKQVLITENELLREELNDEKIQGEELKKNLAESIEDNSEKEKLRDALNAEKLYCAEMGKHLFQLDKNKAEMVDEIGKLRQQLNDVKRYGEELEKKLAEYIEKNSVILTENQKLRADLKAWEQYGGEMEKHL